MSRRLLIALATMSTALVTVGCGGASMRTEAGHRERGARVWAAACGQCHNLRPPTQFDAVQWPVIVNHMRTRADLTRAEAQVVAAFLTARAR